MTTRYWLMKSEPDEFSIDDLARKKVEPWSGVRNYQARNFMRDGMQVGDGVLFYHSSCPEPGIVGIARVASGTRPDPTQFDPECANSFLKAVEEDREARVERGETIPEGWMSTGSSQNASKMQPAFS